MNSDTEKELLLERIETLEEKLHSAEDELASYREARDASRRRKIWAAIFTSRWALRVLAGRLLYEKARALWDAYSDWLRHRRTGKLEPATRDFAAALLNRLLRISTVALFLALLPTALLIAQTVLIYQQNRIISRQNELVGRQSDQMEKQSNLLGKQNEIGVSQNQLLTAQNSLLTKQDERFGEQNELLGTQNNLLGSQDLKLDFQNRLFGAQNELLGGQNDRIDSQLDLMGQQNAKLDMQNTLAGFEQTTGFRDLLYLAPLKPEAVDEELYPPTGEPWVPIWPRPRLTAVSQIVNLGEAQPTLVIRSLLPLLEDSDTTVSSGALVAIQRLLRSRDEGVRTASWGAVSPYYKVGQTRLWFGYQVNLTLANMEGIDLEGAQLSAAKLSWANLGGVNLRHSELVGADLRFASLHNAHLEGSNLFDAKLSGADLRGARLSLRLVGGGTALDAVFIPTNLSLTDLDGANLTGVNLSWSCMRKAKLTLTNLAGVNFNGVDLRGAVIFENNVNRDITPADLTKAGAFFDEDTLFGREPLLGPGGGDERRCAAVRFKGIKLERDPYN